MRRDEQLRSKVTSAPRAILTVTLSPVVPQIRTSSQEPNHITGYVNGGETVFPAVTADRHTAVHLSMVFWDQRAPGRGPNPDDNGSGYSGTQTPSLTVTNLSTD